MVDKRTRIPAFLSPLARILPCPRRLAASPPTRQNGEVGVRRFPQRRSSRGAPLPVPRLVDRILACSASLAWPGSASTSRTSGRCQTGLGEVGGDAAHFRDET